MPIALWYAALAVNTGPRRALFVKALGSHWDCCGGFSVHIGVLAGIMEAKMETTIVYWGSYRDIVLLRGLYLRLGCRVQGLERNNGESNGKNMESEMGVVQRTLFEILCARQYIGC